MKHLILVRHAKAIWNSTDIPDLDRPLSDTGRREVPTMGERLAARGIMPDMIIASPAERAWHTATMLAPYVKLPSDRVEIVEELFLADTDVLLSITQMCDSNVDCLIIVGHNPGITQFANMMTDVAVDNIPTCGMYHMKFDVDAWYDIELKTGDYVAFDFPRNH
ncbi:MAG: histidine phosphatase family protein [Gammaproteobacteria bacterium]|nr:histidine phosphatase family protein [Gammaproteobacteria bacterium]